MKAVLSNRIYLEVDRKLEREIQETLTYRIPGYDPSKPLIIKNYFRFREGILSIPIGRTDLIPNSYEIVDKRSTQLLEFPKFKYDLRESQQTIYDDISDNALINAKVSWGKTFSGLAIAGKFKQKTLVVVHTIPLMNQWAKETEKGYGFKPGLIGNGHDDTSKPITIGNVRSLYNRMDKLTKTFGTVIMDEVHHAPSPIFTKVIDRSYARYKIGLSGTLERKDGKHVVLRDYFGSKIYTPPKENCMIPWVDVIDSGLEFPGGSHWAHRVTAALDNPAYIKLVALLAEEACRNGHRTLVVADRVDFLQKVAKLTGAALIVGGVEDRDAEFDKLGKYTNILCGTQSIMSEGISHDPLSSIILGTPINNMPLLEQLIGRIIRLSPNKQQPVVIDPVFRGYTTQRQFNNRLTHYRCQGYEVRFR